MITLTSPWKTGGRKRHVRRKLLGGSSDGQNRKETERAGQVERLHTHLESRALRCVIEGDEGCKGRERVKDGSEKSRVSDQMN